MGEGRKRGAERRWTIACSTVATGRTGSGSRIGAPDGWAPATGLRVASGLLAAELGADVFVISTGVEKVAINFNQPDERWLERMSASEARAYDQQGHFAEGSMAPKIRAIIEFVDGTGATGLITDPPNIGRALAGHAGTHVVPG